VVAAPQSGLGSACGCRKLPLRSASTSTSRTTGPPVDGSHFIAALAFYCSNGKEPVPSTTLVEFVGRWRSTPATGSSCALPMSAPRELKRRYEAFLAANDIGVDGIELVTDRAGTTYTHDVNTAQSRS
jgi:hypothetical protein